MLTLLELQKIKPGTVFAQGEIENSQKGLYMVDSSIGKMLMWVAKKGYGYDDWCIYTHWADKGLEYVLEQGDKVTSEYNIQKLIPCDKDVLGKYRK